MDDRIVSVVHIAASCPEDGKFRELTNDHRLNSNYATVNTSSLPLPIHLVRPHQQRIRDHTKEMRKNRFSSSIRLHSSPFRLANVCFLTHFNAIESTTHPSSACRRPDMQPRLSLQVKGCGFVPYSVLTCMINCRRSEHRCNSASSSGGRPTGRSYKVKMHLSSLI